MNVDTSILRKRSGILFAIYLGLFAAQACGQKHAPVVAPPPQGAQKAADDWTATLAVPPGSSLPQTPPVRTQVVTLFTVSDSKRVGDQYFVAGTGYVEINASGTYFSGINRKVDPYIELTIMDAKSSTFDECRKLLVQESMAERAVRVSGPGLFTSLQGTPDRKLGIVRLDSLTKCELVGRY